MDGRQKMSLFIIIIMVGSIVGFAIIFTDNPNQSQPAPDVPIENPTTLSFRAENVDATVAQLFSSMRILASTDETDITILDAGIRGVQGIRKVTSQYRQLGSESTLGGSLVYMAEVTFDSKYSAPELLDGIIENTPAFIQVEAYPYGLVSLPETVTFKNETLDIEKEHTFPNPITQALLSVGSIVGDEILITIDAEFIGAVPGRMVAYETQNKSASMLFVSAPGTYKISEMLPALSFSSTVPLSSAPEKSVLENEILALENVEGIELNFPEPEYSITLSLDQNIPAVQPDLNLALWEVPGITEIGWRTAGMRIDYDGNYSVQEMESSIRSAIADTNFTITEMQLPEIEISAELTLANADARQTASALSSLLESRSLPAEIYQSALFKYETISDTEGNEYAVKNGEFTGFISPQYSAGAEIELDIFFFATRNSADSISAYEKEEAVPEGEAA